MDYQEAKRLLHPDTTRDAIWEIADKQEALKKINEACLLACEAMDELQEYKKARTLEETRSQQRTRNKVLLAMNEPDNCDICPFCDDCDYTCGAFQILNEKYTYEVPTGRNKPDWCPLKRMPQKKSYEELSDGNPVKAWGNGWNACIDEILEGQNE